MYRVEILHPVGDKAAIFTFDKRESMELFIAAMQLACTTEAMVSIQYADGTWGNIYL